ncbi:MGH1-like glycoside hydrolase domain-containing protein [Synechococcus sp. BS55D]|uniref:MGH1-like glycoside hydrolase domain-containing protein n=1 Tax=Synechococcus sp. BS55D TaxID=2055943 RepID=UPI00103A0C5D|nr:glucosidase [Synechococcus sp. BS55D]TCD56928.1 glucosidase [Synechococcus sp. BS55D]
MQPAELLRCQQRDAGLEPWDRWGTYLSDRQWGTVREDYSADGNAWASFPFDHSHLRSYRWGEDGLLGLSDEQGLLCLAPVLWNGKDPILKERLFGLGNPEGNHGEDIKEAMYHLAGTPTGSYAKALYRYPQCPFPYQQLRDENRQRGRDQPEFELVHTGAFDESRFFDLEVEIAKATPEDLLIRYTVTNQGPEAAAVHLLPSLWFRNTWSWGDGDAAHGQIEALADGVKTSAIPGLPAMELRCSETGDWLFTENETNTEALYEQPLQQPYVKDAFHRYVIQGEQDAVNPQRVGSRSALHLQRTLAAGEVWCVDLRLCRHDRRHCDERNLLASEHASTLLQQRRAEWSEHLGSITGALDLEDQAIHAAAAAGLFWCRKFYNWNVSRWLRGDRTGPKPPEARWHSENAYWKTLRSRNVISMPDCWEYPYFCQWDLMFHAVAFAELDPGEAKRQCRMLRQASYTANNGQSPAYEWALSDANPPIGAWAALRIAQIEQRCGGRLDNAFLRSVLRELLLEYGWWANRTDRNGDSLFEGGFLGLDNIAIFDRRYPLKDGSRIEQSDGTAWMGMCSLNMLEIAVTLHQDRPEYAELTDRFIDDFCVLCFALNSPGVRGFVNWDEQDGFYYDILKRPDGSSDYLRTRSLAGLIPLLGIASFDADQVARIPNLDVRRTISEVARERGAPFDHINHLGSWHRDRVLYSLVPPSRLRRILTRVFDENEFLSPYGIRSLSKVYETSPYSYVEGSDSATISYSPADSPVAMFGGNSNWRGPIWMPINFLLIEALQKYGHFFGDDFLIEFPTGSGQQMNLWQISLELQKRLVGIFRRDPEGRRAFNGDVDLFQKDPLWRDLFLFNEYFHGCNGAGVGASHQTGWTAVVAKMLTQLKRWN